VAGGFGMGAVAWTLKSQRRFKVEHWLLPAMFTILSNPPRKPSENCPK
jgi:hypothetical protein